MRFTGFAKAFLGAALLMTGVVAAGVVHAAGPADAAQPTHILLLHSYHPGFDWTDQVTMGIRSALRDAQDGVELTIEYMDAKRRSDSDYLARLADLYRLKFPPDFFRAIITVDDDALEFALANRAVNFPGVPIVYCGMSHEPSQLVAGQGDVTGVVEVHDIRKTMELALQLHPGTELILAINDTTTTGLARQEQIDKAAAVLAGRARVETVANVTDQELENRLSSLGPRDLVFLQSFNRDRAGHIFNPKQIMALVNRATRRPVYTCKEEYLGLGVVGGFLTAGSTHGELAARMALRIIAGESVSRLPVITDGVNPAKFDGQVLGRLGIDPGDLPAGSVLVNREPSFLAANRWPILASLAIFLGLLAIILALGAELRFRRRAGAELRESREDLSITLDSIGDGVIATDRNGIVTRLNPVAARLCAIGESEAVGKSFVEVFRIVDAATRSPMEFPFDRIVKAGESITLTSDSLLQARDGTSRRISDSASPIRDHEGFIRGMVLVFRDVTEHLRIEEQLRQATKMETIGRLAGGVAHDFNNLLGGIIGYTDLLLMHLRDDRLRSFATAILEAAQRAASLTQNLLTFSRKGSMRDVSVEIHQAIGDVIGILERTIDRRIVINRRLGAARTTVNGDPSQIQSAILNLGVNARDAMQTGGTLEFSTENVTIGESEADGDMPLEPGSYVSISVSDTGIGIAETVKPHIFEPFFSTKPSGEGTGLGLAAVYGTVKAHRGRISIHSQPGRGTRFTILLPVSEASTQLPEMVSAAAAAKSASGGVILLVDDEKVIRTMARDILSSLGYEVVVAENGESAVDIYRENRARIDLVIMDVIMPKMNGPEAAAALHAINPEVKILLSTGFDFGSGSRGLLGQNGVVGILTKPYRSIELGKAVRSALEK
jgi:PAS domain S-box-containing protein